MHPVSPVIPGEDLPEIIAGQNQPEYENLPLVNLGEGVVLSRWKLSPEELAIIQKTGDLYVFVHTFGHPLQPMSIQVEKPEDGDEVTPYVEADPNDPEKEVWPDIVGDPPANAIDRKEYTKAEIDQMLERQAEENKRMIEAIQNDPDFQNRTIYLGTDQATFTTNITGDVNVFTGRYLIELARNLLFIPKTVIIHRWTIIRLNPDGTKTPIGLDEVAGAIEGSVFQLEPIKPNEIQEPTSSGVRVHSVLIKVLGESAAIPFIDDLREPKVFYGRDIVAAAIINKMIIDPDPDHWMIERIMPNGSRIVIQPDQNAILENHCVYDLTHTGGHHDQ